VIFFIAPPDRVILSLKAKDPVVWMTGETVSGGMSML